MIDESLVLSIARFHEAINRGKTCYNNRMLFVSLMRWWYGLGWLDQLALIRLRFEKTADFFSIGLTLRTLTQPFKQIDADRRQKGSLDVILRAMFDQLFSRFMGLMVRSILILIGCLALALEVLLGGLRLMIWPLVPILPLLMLPLMMSGWVPWR